MRLKIDNFAKVKHADIVIDGITVIAGENNTGKSTIGKVLYATFNSLYNIDLKIEERRKVEIQVICRDYIGNALINNRYIERIPLPFSARKQSVLGKISNEVSDSLIEIDGNKFNKVSYKELIQQSCEKYKIILPEEDISELIENSYEKILSRKMNDDYKIAIELIERFFDLAFGSQIGCLNISAGDPKVSLKIKDKNLKIQFKGNQCVDWKAEYRVLHEAFFVDDPFILDDISGYFPVWSTKGMRGQLLDRLNETDDDILEGIFEAVSAKENLKELYEILGNVSEGQIYFQNRQWGLHSKRFDEPVHFENLSAGLKSFVLLKLLLEKGILKEKDVLILDEPEIHLHPEWQLMYAEIIVLLQKKFDLSIVVTTHSRDFLEAIELYARKYKLFSKCRFYLSKLEQELAVFENVTDSLDKVYKQLITPSMLLDKIRYEMELEEDE